MDMDQVGDGLPVVLGARLMAAPGQVAHRHFHGQNAVAAGRGGLWHAAGIIIFQPPIMDGAVGQAFQPDACDIFRRGDIRWHRGAPALEPAAKLRRVGAAKDQVEDIDAMGTQFRPQSFAKAQVEGLAAGIDAETRRAAIAGARSDEDDAAAFALAHGGAEQVGGLHDRYDITRDKVGPCLDVRLEKGGAIGIAARVADVEADLAIFAHCRDPDDGVGCGKVDGVVTHSVPWAACNAVASTASGSFRRAMRMSFRPSAAKRWANAAPVPSDAPAINAHGPYLAKMLISCSHASSGAVVDSAGDAASRTMLSLQYSAGWHIGIR